VYNDGLILQGGEKNYRYMCSCLDTIPASDRQTDRNRQTQTDRHTYRQTAGAIIAKTRVIINQLPQRRKSELKVRLAPARDDVNHEPEG